MFQIEKKKNVFVRTWEWCLSLTTPPPPPSNASFAVRDHARRSLAASIILWILLISVALGSVLYIFSGDLNGILTILVTIASAAFLLFLNRKGLVSLATILCILASTLQTIFYMTGKSQAIQVADLRVLDNLILSLMLGALLLPLKSIFLIAVFNFIVYAGILLYLPISPELQSSINTVLTHFGVLQFEITFIAYLWGRSMINEISRADKAEELTELERTLAQQNDSIILEKEMLDAAIQDIVQTHVEIANGNYNARVPIRNNVLWSVSGALNNLLNRVQGWRQEAQELQQLRTALHSVTQELHTARQMNRAPRIEQTGTALDGLLIELQTQSRHVPSQHLQQNNPRMPIDRPYQNSGPRSSF